MARKIRKHALPGDIACCHGPGIKALNCCVGCTLPITSAEAERSFSGLRRIKSYLRSRMTEERLSGLALMHIHSEMDINVETICDLFVTKHRRRIFQSCILYQ